MKLIYQNIEMFIQASYIMRRIIIRLWLYGSTVKILNSCIVN